MDEALRDQLIDLFDASPATVEEFREIVRRLVSHLPQLDTLEAEIMAWDASGREPGQFERLRERAWDFEETGELDYRKRLFAGFVTTSDATDGFGADFLIDTSSGLGISASDTYEAMTSQMSR